MLKRIEEQYRKDRLHTDRYGGGGSMNIFNIRVTLSTLSFSGERCFIGSRINPKTDHARAQREGLERRDWRRRV
jgi:hypothetical protein